MLLAFLWFCLVSTPLVLSVRHEPPDKDGETDPQIQVQNAKLGISTFWSLEKFQSKLVAMRELEQVGFVCNASWEMSASKSLSYIIAPLRLI